MKIALFAVLLLAGCATAPTVVRPETVKIPVPVPCKIDMPEKPAWPRDSLPKDANRPVWLRAAMEELDLRVAYELKFEAAALSCIGR